MVYKAKFKIGDVVKTNGGWTATIKSRKYDYAYGLTKRSKKKMWLYTLKNEKGKELMGLWGEPELIENNMRNY